MTGQTAVPVVLISRETLAPLLDDAAAQYRRAWESFRRSERYLPRCWALLLGRMDDAVIRVEEMRWARNVRESDPVVLEEFGEVIVPCFGPGYADGRRGYWCDPADVLRISREAEQRGLDLLGSVHMHADMHRFWPEHAAGTVLSERPTPMDEYLFRNGAWPLNMICHLESVAEQVVVRIGAWAPPPFRDHTSGAIRMDVQLCLGEIAAPHQQTAQETPCQ
jgi:hypothetical protein